MTSPPSMRNKNRFRRRRQYEYYHEYYTGDTICVIISFLTVIIAYSSSYRYDTSRKLPITVFDFTTRLHNIIIVFVSDVSGTYFLGSCKGVWCWGVFTKRNNSSILLSEIRIYYSTHNHLIFRGKGERGRILRWCRYLYTIFVYSS